MGRRLVAAILDLDTSSPRTPTAPVLQIGIISRQLTLILPVSLPTATELIRRSDYFYRATPCMGRRRMAAVRVLARCSPSTPMARVLGSCIFSRPVVTTAPTATQLI